jgi:hypothetical protein
MFDINLLLVDIGMIQSAAKADLLLRAVKKEIQKMKRNSM